MELRCASGILHGVIDVDNGTIEFRCRSNRCGHAPGVVALHTFDFNKGEVVDTSLYRDPVRREDNNGNADQRDAARHQGHPCHADGS